jgi:hypothetical protein
MPEAISSAVPDRTAEPGRPARLTLNSDGRKHPALNAAVAFTFVFGVLAFPIGLIVRDHFLATIVGIVSFGAGLLAQLLSATREQRVLLMCGVVAGFVGMGLGIAHGGFSVG